MLARMIVLALITVCTSASPGLAWDAYGHRLITQLALEGLPPDSPAWLKDKDCIVQVMDQATVPDRWRSTKVGQLTHLNNPDHYIDVEDLEPCGLSLRRLPPLRYEFVKQLVLARERAGADFKGRPVNPARDPDKTAEWPGFVPYSIAEQYGKVQSAFRTIRILETLDNPARAQQLDMARQNARYNMGILSHYVGDSAQPLHTTKHHHGWVGPNEKGYSTDGKIHSYIDGGVLKLHRIDAAGVRPLCKFNTRIDAGNPWEDVLTYIERSFVQVEPLYELEKSGEMNKSPGKEFIETRLADAASMLSALYRTAYETAKPTDKDIKDFERYDSFDATP